MGPYGGGGPGDQQATPLERRVRHYHPVGLAKLALVPGVERAEEAAEARRLGGLRRRKEGTIAVAG